MKQVDDSTFRQVITGDPTVLKLLRARTVPAMPGTRTPRGVRMLVCIRPSTAHEKPACGRFRLDSAPVLWVAFCGSGEMSEMRLTGVTRRSTDHLMHVLSRRKERA